MTKAGRSHAMSSALVWRLLELVRRHPDRLWVQAEGGAMYDRVTLLDLAADPVSWLLTMNAAGTNCAFKSGETLRWTDAVVDGADPAAWVRRVEQLCGLPHRGGPLPPSTPASLAVRFVSIFLLTQLGSRTTWLPRPTGAFDPARGWHAQVSQEWRRVRSGEDSELVYLHRVGDAGRRWWSAARVNFGAETGSGSHWRIITAAERRSWGCF